MWPFVSVITLHLQSLNTGCISYLWAFSLLSNWHRLPHAHWVQVPPPPGSLFSFLPQSPPLPGWVVSPKLLRFLRVKLTTTGDIMKQWDIVAFHANTLVFRDNLGQRRISMLRKRRTRVFSEISQNTVWPWEKSTLFLGFRSPHPGN